MTIVLVRHGDYSPSYIDPEEGLTENGCNQITTLQKKLKDKGILFDKVYCSPKKRAFQTAQLLTQNTEIQQTDLLNPGADPKALYDFIQTLPDNHLLVGHNPLLSSLSNYFGKPYQFEMADCLIINQNSSYTL